MNMSIAIPFHGARYKWTMMTIHNMHSFGCVDEIVVNAEPGSEDFFRLKQNTSTYRKVKMFENDKKYGPFLNKIETVSKCGSEWVALIDSDNVVSGTYLPIDITDNDLCSQVIYCPSIGMPNLDYRSFIGTDINLKLAVELLGQKGFDMLLNTGNYLFHKKTWLDALMASYSNSFNPSAADVLWSNFNCLKAGMVLRVVYGMSYTHNVHPGSTYLQTHQESRVREGEIKAMMRREYEDRRGAASVHADSAKFVSSPSNFAATGGSSARVVSTKSSSDKTELLTD